MRDFYSVRLDCTNFTLVIRPSNSARLYLNAHDIFSGALTFQRQPQADVTKLLLLDDTETIWGTRRRNDSTRLVCVNTCKKRLQLSSAILTVIH